MTEVRPIDANALLEEIKSLDATIGGASLIHKQGKESIVKLIEQQPTLDNEPIVHAHWEDDGHGYYVCSHCEDYIVTDEDGNPAPFLKNDCVLNIHRCPHCDAKMDEEQK